MAVHHVCAPQLSRGIQSVAWWPWKSTDLAEKAAFISKETKCVGKLISTASCIHLRKELIFLIVVFMSLLKREEEI